MGVWLDYAAVYFANSAGLLVSFVNSAGLPVYFANSAGLPDSALKTA